MLDGPRARWESALEFTRCAFLRTLFRSGQWRTVTDTIKSFSYGRSTALMHRPSPVTTRFSSRLLPPVVLNLLPYLFHLSSSRINARDINRRRYSNLSNSEFTRARKLWPYPGPSTLFRSLFFYGFSWSLSIAFFVRFFSFFDSLVLFLFNCNKSLIWFFCLEFAIFLSFSLISSFSFHPLYFKFCSLPRANLPFLFPSLFYIFLYPSPSFSSSSSLASFLHPLSTPFFLFPLNLPPTQEQTFPFPLLQYSSLSSSIFLYLSLSWFYFIPFPSP